MPRVDIELRHALDKTTMHAMMDDLMVSFSSGQNYHYNYYFDTEDDQMYHRETILRCRTIIEGAKKQSFLTLKIASPEEDAFVEYTQELTDKEMKEMVYSNILPFGEIKDLTAIHTGHVVKKQTIRVSRVMAPYKDLYLFFDKITVRGIPHYEIGTKISAGPGQDSHAKKTQFFDLLKSFGQTYTQAPRRSDTFRRP